MPEGPQQMFLRPLDALLGIGALVETLHKLNSRVGKPLTRLAQVPVLLPVGVVATTVQIRSRRSALTARTRSTCWAGRRPTATASAGCRRRWSAEQAGNRAEPNPIGSRFRPTACRLQSHLLEWVEPCRVPSHGAADE
jgi:hypothetical protein